MKRSRLFMGLIAIALIALITVMPVAAKTITVCASGCDYSSINAAYASTDPGDTIFVYNGTYSGYDLRINKPNITLKGEGADVVTYDGGSDKQLVFGDGVDAPGCILEGFTLKGAVVAKDLVRSYAPNSIIRNCVFEGLTSASGILLTASNTTFENNVVNATTQLLEVSGSNCTIMNNVFSNSATTYSAIYLKGNSCTFANNTVIDNKCTSGTSSRAICIKEASNCIVVNNTITGNNGDGIRIWKASAANNIIKRNNISANTRCGIYLYDAGIDNKLYLNDFIDNPTSVIYSGAAPATTYWNSTEQIGYVYGCTEYTNYLGNYWSPQYTGTDGDGDGIGDTSYGIPPASPVHYDFRPLMSKFENYFKPAAAEPPFLVTYTISNRTITPPQTTAIDVEFSEEVNYKIAIEKDTATIYDWTGTAKNPAAKVWDGTYEVNDSVVPGGDYTVNVTGTNTTTGLSVVNNTEIITVMSITELPDLIPAAITTPANIFATESNEITATIANIGTADAEAFNVSLSADGTEVAEVNVTSGLNAGTSTELSFEWTPAAAGTYELCVVADCDAAIVESDETNNVTCKDVEAVVPKATVYFVPEDIRIPKYCDTRNVSIWINTEDVITSGRMEFEYTYCCMNVTGYTINTTNWVPPSGMALTPGKVRIILNAAGLGVGPGLLHVGNITVHCCNDTGYCFTDLTWNKTTGASGYYLFNDTPAMIPVRWDDGTFRCNIPDLVITNVRGVELNETHYNVSYSIKNVGEVKASASYANLSVDDTQVETMLVPELLPDEEQTYSFASEIELTGDYDTLKVCADYNDTVVELDETKNCMVARYPGEVVISVVPRDTFVQPQDQFDVMIHVNPKGMPVYAVQYYLSYDTSVVRAETQTKGPFLGTIAETIVVVNKIDQPHGETSYAETRKVPGGADTANNVSTVHLIAIGPRNATTTLHLHDIIISNEDGERMGYTIENGTVKITANQPPTPIGVTKHRINNVAKKYQSTAILCSCSFDPDWPGKGGNISYIRWAFGDGQYGTSEGLPVDNCTCKEHRYESWLWNSTSNDYDPFTAVLTVTDDGCPEMENSTTLPITVYIAGDANGDGEVNVLDVVWVGKNWRRECPTTNPCANNYNCTAYLWDDEQQVDSADLNNDCEINVLDVVIIGANWRHVAG